MIEVGTEREERGAAVKRAGEKCERCNGPFNPKGRRPHTFEVHHRVRRVDGGLDHRDNYEVLCLDCHDEERRKDRREGRFRRIHCTSFTEERLTYYDHAEGMAMLKRIAAAREMGMAAALRQLVREEARRLDREGAE